MEISAKQICMNMPFENREPIVFGSHARTFDAGSCAMKLPQEEKRKRDAIYPKTSLWCTILALLILGHNIYADENYTKSTNEQSGGKSVFCSKDANDPNELWWSKWDAVVKDPNNPNELLEAKWNAVITVVQSKELDQNLKKKIIDKLTSPIFDSELMAKLALGKANWPKLTDPQRRRFTDLFAKRLKNFYLDKTTLYKNEKALFKPAIHEKDFIYIPMALIHDEKEVSILYKLYKKDKCWKIYDVQVEGVSILLTYRSQFDDILSRGTIEDIFSELEKPPTS